MSRDIVVRFPDATAKALDAHKARTGVSISETIRRAVRDRLDARGTDMFVREHEDSGEELREH